MPTETDNNSKFLRFAGLGSLDRKVGSRRPRASTGQNDGALIEEIENNPFLEFASLIGLLLYSIWSRYDYLLKHS
jgi:hypothetical protein